MSNLKIQDLLDWIEKSNIPKDFEIWMEFPQKSGVASGTKENPSYECVYSDIELVDVEYISSALIGVDKNKKRIYIYHHY